MGITKLFQPCHIGKMQLRNRTVMAAMNTGLDNNGGEISALRIDHYARMAEGGIGLIIVEAISILQHRRAAPVMAINSDVFIPGWKRMVDAVHAHGAKIAPQITHNGRQNPSAAERNLVAPSAIPCMVYRQTPRALTIGEIEGIVEKFALTAKRSQEIGFDAVEIHGAHGYLIDQFLSPYTNKRTDKYGGDMAGRMKLSLDIVKHTRETVGPDFPIIFRLSADEHVPGGLTLKDTSLIAQRLEEAGVDCLDVSAGIAETRQWYIQPYFLPHGCLIDLAEGIKKVVKIPVIAVGKINAVMAEQVIAEGKADLVAFGRPLFADPEMPNKAREGRLDDIRQCIYCNHCYDQRCNHQASECSVNATLGKSTGYEVAPASKRKKVLIAGGGPAGMEAARVSSLRGHQVILCEKESKLGGQLRLACVPPYKQDIANLTDYLTTQMSKLGVDIRLGQEVTPELVAEIKPDAVIVATGATPATPTFPGMEEANVVQAWDVLAGKKVGDKIVIIGGGRVGCELAEFLADQGKKVTIVRAMGLGPIAGDVGISTRPFLLTRLKERGVRIETDFKVDKIMSYGVAITSEDKRGYVEFIEADNIILAPPAQSNRLVVDQLTGKVELYTVGDCVQPRLIVDAIHDAFRISREL
ncbi:FAD-dependent oxidoreductase [Chloroflexota bacterium]